MSVRILVGDALAQLRTLDTESVQCCVTSPPYWGLRDYGVAGQLGLEGTPEEYVARLVATFAEVRRVLRKDGTLWLNIGDSYCAAPKGSLNGQDKSGLTSTRSQMASPIGVDKRPRVGRNPKAGQQNADLQNAPHRAQPLRGIKPKDLILIPFEVAKALRADGWYLRWRGVWAKPNGMPGSQKDRPTVNYEDLFIFSKSRRYFYDWRAVTTPLAESSLARLEQPTLEQQGGSSRANGGGKTNGAMKAVKFGGNKRHNGSGGGCLEREREREREFSTDRTYSGNAWRRL